MCSERRCKASSSRSSESVTSSSGTSPSASTIAQPLATATGVRSSWANAARKRSRWRAWSGSGWLVITADPATRKSRTQRCSSDGSMSHSRATSSTGLPPSTESTIETRGSTAAWAATRGSASSGVRPPRSACGCADSGVSVIAFLSRGKPTPRRAFPPRSPRERVRAQPHATASRVAEPRKVTSAASAIRLRRTSQRR